MTWYEEGLCNRSNRRVERVPLALLFPACSDDWWLISWRAEAGAVVPNSYTGAAVVTHGKASGGGVRLRANPLRNVLVLRDNKVQPVGLALARRSLQDRQSIG